MGGREIGIDAGNEPAGRIPHILWNAGGGFKETEESYGIGCP